MSYDKADIFNLALGHLGVSKLVTDPEGDTSTQAKTCRLHYDLALDVTLKAHRWPFAQRVATLATLSGYESDVWTYAYRAPSDMLKPHTINRLASDPQGQRFEEGGDTSGGIIYTDAEDAILDYTALVTNTGLFPADFVEALALQLAIRAAQPLAADESLRQVARNGYKDAITEAMATAANSGVGQEPPECDFLAARSTLSET